MPKINYNPVFCISDYQGNLLWESNGINIEIEKNIVLKPSITVLSEFKFQLKSLFFVWLNSYFVRDDMIVCRNEVDGACRNSKYIFLFYRIDFPQISK